MSISLIAIPDAVAIAADSGSRSRAAARRCTSPGDRCARPGAAPIGGS